MKFHAETTQVGLKVTGDMTEQSSIGMTSVLMNSIGPGPHALLVDLSDVHRFDQTGIHFLSMLRRKAARQQRPLQLLGTTAVVRAAEIEFRDSTAEAMVEA
jgi:anti-anti-sigma regulatory factor